MCDSGGVLSKKSGGWGHFSSQWGGTNVPAFQKGRFKNANGVRGPVPSNKTGEIR